MNHRVQPDIAELLPHAGSMVLIDEICEYDDARIVCLSRSHTAVENPLRRGECLDSTVLLEYAAQATAIHGGLTQPHARGRVAFLAAARNLDLTSHALNTLTGALKITAARLMDAGDGVIYATEITHRGRALMRARLTIMTAPNNPTDGEHA